MGGTGGRGAQQSPLGGWFSGTLGAIEQERQAAEAAGREVYENAIRTGQNVQARTRAELIALGRSKLAQDAAQAVNTAARAVRDPNTWRGAAMQADAFTRGVANTATLGAADHIAAFGDAITDGGPLSSLQQRYQANLQDQQLRDAYDAAHRRAAQVAGQVAGVGASFMDGMEAGTAWSTDLSAAEKGKLGEGLSQAKSWLLGDPAVETQVARPLQNGKKTIVDQINQSGRWGESKFGYSAGPTPNQLQAAREQGSNYYFDRWYPHHIGYGLGGVQAGITGIGAAIDDDQ